ncbi:magnesium transport protein CorA [Gordonia crocea]|uniref:Magnesium transport protein CorA n=1 Tax=Gordonia crocea TaxID=589162 RepID=A0A7I9UX79_9ACTN|nr:magnesium and cobalt transport protein CorA [Gordonia crocea]GED97410.1 magnesium transport protein CorA [Gordonia crocea]
MSVDPVVDCGVYVNGVRDPAHRHYTDALAHVRSTGQGFVWLGLHAPDDAQMAAVASVFDLHELAVEDAVVAHQRPKLEVYGDSLFMVFRTVAYVDHLSIAETAEVVSTGEIMVFVGADYVITVRHGDQTELSSLRHRMEASPDLLALGPTVVLHAVADRVVDSYLVVVDEIDTDIEEIEEDVFGGSTVAIDPVYLLKREVIEFRRAATPLAAPLARLTAPNPWLSDEVRTYLRDVADHLTTVNERVIDYDNLLSSMLDAATAKVGIQQNTDMRKITAWAAMAAAPTMIAGIYGMNFDHMPELHWRYGYFVVIGVMVAISLTLWRTFRKHGWL